MENFENNNGYNAGFDNSGESNAYTEEPRAEQAPVQEQSGWQAQPQDGWSYPGNGPKQPKQPKEKKQKKGAGRVVALALVCAVLGGVGGGAITGAVASSKYESQAQAMQKQIDDLKANSGGGNSTTILTGVSAEGLKSGAQIYAENVDAVVSVTVKGVATSQYGTQNFESRGTGFLISKDGYILTNQHVVDSASEITVTMNDGTVHEAQLIGSDAYYDVALLKIEGEDLPAVTIGDSDNTAVGEEVVAIGNALGELSSSFTGGYLSGVDRMVSTDGTAINMMQTDAAINSGNSGGPLFNMQGEVIGITSAKYSGSTSSGASIEGIGFAIPINDVMDLVDDLRDYGYVTGQAYLGVMVRDMSVDANIAAAYGLPLGVQVDSVEEGGAADKAGIQPQDIIIALGDDTVESMSDLQSALRHRKAGDTDTITVYRSGQEIVLTITFDEKQVAAEEPATEPAESQGNSDESPELPDQDADWDEWYDFFSRFFGRR